MVNMDAHSCNAYCQPPEHCDLVFTSQAPMPAAKALVADAYRRSLGLLVTHIETAREAPELEAMDPAELGAPAWPYVRVQNVYFEGGLFPIAYPDREGSVANIGAAMDAAKEAGVPVVVVRHTSPDGAPAFAGGTPEWLLHPLVDSRAADHLVEKQTSSAFYDTDLGDWLAERDVDTVAIAGYMTQNCDLATSFDAHARDLGVEFLVDATGTLPLATSVGKLTAEQVHETLLIILSSLIASVHTTEQRIAAVREGRELPGPNIVEATAPARVAEAAVG
jgi:nicotinamidase-related amidase